MPLRLTGILTLILVTLVTVSGTCKVWAEAPIARGGPGMDGGGGNVVLTANGTPRFLDLAKSEGLALQPFSRLALRDLMIRKAGRSVSRIGRKVEATDFFACANSLFEKSGNPQLMNLRSTEFRIGIETVLTDLPLFVFSQENNPLVYSNGSAWAYRVSSLPTDQLASPSLAAELQQPVASYLHQANGRIVNDFSAEVLVINVPLYESLPEKDRCAVQVHEIFRYANSLSNRAPIRPFSRALSTTEIEALTVKVVLGEEITAQDLPVTTNFRIIALYGLERLRALESDKLRSIEEEFLRQDRSAGVFDSHEMSLASALILEQMTRNAAKTVAIAEQGVEEIAADSRTRAAAMIREHARSLRARAVNLVDLFTDY